MFGITYNSDITEDFNKFSVCDLQILLKEHVFDLILERILLKFLDVYNSKCYEFHKKSQVFVSDLQNSMIDHQWVLSSRSDAGDQSLSFLPLTSKDII